MDGLILPTPEETTAPPAEEVSEAVLRSARELVKEFFTQCFWFRHPDATIDDRSDVLLVIRHLREYGNHKAWRAAQELRKCL